MQTAAIMCLNSFLVLFWERLNFKHKSGSQTFLLSYVKGTWLEATYQNTDAHLCGFNTWMCKMIWSFKTLSLLLSAARWETLITDRTL